MIVWICKKKSKYINSVLYCYIIYDKYQKSVYLVPAKIFIKHIFSKNFLVISYPWTAIDMFIMGNRKAINIH